MGIELVLLLVDQTSLELLLQKSWNELYNGMEGGVFRDERPTSDHRLKRSFDIDCEAELLDWMDSTKMKSEEPVVKVLKELDDGCEGSPSHELGKSRGLGSLGRSSLSLS